MLQTERVSRILTAHQQHKSVVIDGVSRFLTAHEQHESDVINGVSEQIVNGARAAQIREYRVTVA